MRSAQGFSMSDDNNTDLEKRLEALEAKNAELLGELKAERNKRRDADAAKAEAEEAARQAAEDAAAKSGDIEALKAQWETKSARAIEAERKAREAAENQLHKLVIEGGIDSALDAAGMAPAYKRMLRRDFAAEHQIEIRDGQAFANGEPLADAVKKWAETDNVAGLKAASLAAGSGAPGGGKQHGRTLAEMSEAERTEMAKQNPQQFRQLIAEAKRR